MDDLEPVIESINVLMISPFLLGLEEPDAGKAGIKNGFRHSSGDLGGCGGTNSTVQLSYFFKIPAFTTLPVLVNGAPMTSFLLFAVVGFINSGGVVIVVAVVVNIVNNMAVAPPATMKPIIIVVCRLHLLFLFLLSSLTSFEA